MRRLKKIVPHLVIVAGLAASMIVWYAILPKDSLLALLLVMITLFFVVLPIANRFQHRIRKLDQRSKEKKDAVHQSPLGL